MAQLTFEVVTPEGLVFETEIYEVILPTPLGYIAILPHHAPLIALLAPGVMSVRHRAEDPDSALEHLALTEGFVEVSHQRVRVLADSAERADDIDELKVQEALQQAHEARKQAKDQVSLADATTIIEQNAARLKVAELKRHRR